MCKHREQNNFETAHSSGAIHQCLNRWNREYLETKGLHVRVELPGGGTMAQSDLASSKLYRFQQRNGFYSPAVGSARIYAGTAELRYQSREGKARVRAARKGRIIVLPLAMVSESGRARTLLAYEQGVKYHFDPSSDWQHRLADRARGHRLRSSNSSRPHKKVS